MSETPHSSRGETSYNDERFELGSGPGFIQMGNVS